MAQTRTAAPASGTPRELKTMSSLRVPCACTGPTAPGTTCSASASNAQRNPIAIFDRIIAASKLGLVGVCYTQQRKRGETMSSYLSLGPYVQAALLCERVVQESGGRVTIVRLIDRVIAPTVATVGPAQIPPTIVSCHAVVILKTGSRPGNYKLRLLLTSPSKRPIREFSLNISLPDEEDQGVNGVMPIQFPATEEGVYWFEVRLDNEEWPLTKTSLRLVRRR